MLVGELEGEVSTDRFRFEAHRDIEKFDFVAVKNPKQEGREWILAQVDSVTRSPDGKTECEAAIIGYRERGLLKKPRHVVKPDSMVYSADEEVIAETLGLGKEGLYLGRLETNPDIRIFMNPDDLQTHLAILAKTGAGKSYTTGVLIEELLERDFPVIVIDPHGEYSSLSEENSIREDDRDKYEISPGKFDVREFTTDTAVNSAAEKLTFSSRNLDAKELQQMIPTSLTNSQLEVLYKALKSLKDRESYTLDDIIDAAMGQDSKAKWNLVNILEIVKDSDIFSGEETPLEDLVVEGSASIINLKGVDPQNQEMTVYKLASDLFQRRKTGDIRPFIMVIEEAHNFVPERNFGKTVCSDVLRTIASEGRKFGLGLVVVSQRPARVDKNILSQCNTQIIMRVTNPNDLNAISKSFEGVTREVKNSITSLPPGVGLILGKEYPIMTDIRTRKSLHGGATVDISGGEREEPSEFREREIEEEGGVEEVPGIDVLVPSISPGDVDAPDVNTALYPIWIASAGDERIAIDGTDGEVKDRSVPLKERERRVLELLRDEDRGVGEIVENLGGTFSDVRSMLDNLARKGIVEKEGDRYFRESPGILEREVQKFGGRDYRLIDTEVAESRARKIGKRRMKKEPEDVRKVYYPYYTSGNRVFDGVTGEEI